MQDYTTTGKFVMHAGALVRLSPAQAAARAHRIAKTDQEGVFEVIKSIEFKAGEQIGVAGVLNKAQAEALKGAAPAPAADGGKGKKKPTPPAVAPAFTEPSEV